MIRNVFFIKPRTLKEALEKRAMLLERSKIIAGGTDLMIELRREGGRGLTLIDVSSLNEIKGIEKRKEYLRIGAGTTHSEIASSPVIRKYFPLLSTACFSIGSPQIRARGTVGGNIVNASPCADSLTSLIALDTKIVLSSVNEDREIEIKDFVLSPYKTDLKNDEILKEIRIYYLPKGARTSFLKLGRRNALAIARINVSAILTFFNGRILDARVAAGSVMPKTQRLTVVEDYLKGKAINEEIFKIAGEIANEEMIKVSGRRWSTPYKEPVVQALVKRALYFCAQK